MKTKILSLLFLFVSYLSQAQLNTFYVKPNIIDTHYVAAQDSHYVALNTSVASNNLLLVFIGGSTSKTKDYTYFPKLAANLGYHVVSIAYPNPLVAPMCTNSSDSLCYDEVRQEVCYGTPVSSNVSIDTLNSLNMRIVKLLQYLDLQYPSKGWGQFLSGNDIIWSNVVTSGHSQGSGHALYFGQTNSVYRVLMFAGADDYSNYFNQPAHWEHGTGITPISKVYSFLHLGDDVLPYPKEYAIIQSIGLTSAGDDSTNVDNLSSPYNNSHCLYSNITPRFPGIYSSYHDAPIVDFYTPLSGTTPLYTTVWTYMLSLNTSGIKTLDNHSSAIKIYPNPASSILNIEISHLKETIEVKLYDILGNEIISTTSSYQQYISFNITDLPNGIYFIKVGNIVQKFIKE